MDVETKQSGITLLVCIQKTTFLYAWNLFFVSVGYSTIRLRAVMKFNSISNYRISIIIIKYRMYDVEQILKVGDRMWRVQTVCVPAQLAPRPMTVNIASGVSNTGHVSFICYCS